MILLGAANGRRFSPPRRSASICSPATFRGGIGPTWRDRPLWHRQFQQYIPHPAGDQLGRSLNATILIYALFNLVAALASFPAGYLSDHFGRKRVLLLSFVVFLVVYAGFGLATDTVLIDCLFVFYGLHQGIYRAVGEALATDFVPAELRAIAIGWYSATIGVTGLIASIAPGKRLGRPSARRPHFLGLAGSALLGSVSLVLFVVRTR